MTQQRDRGQRREPKVSAEEAAAAAERFLAAVKESDRLDAAKRERAKAAQAKSNELNEARRALDLAIAEVRRAKESGRGRAEADAAWKVAKARVIELETGDAPSWAPAPAASESVDSESVDSEPAGNESAEVDSTDSAE
jgi:hypothetical protein